ncbi:flagellar filament capping protein FliD [Desulfurivibrio alkaliphilus]|uniref:Flagellar hook-associated protein 2 n=1 Tax=Desulfurivibrio alkaliphilus (strain DSM 19089 / UNIQEM U267 / AHT2) TaxID=589865 RepID=D6Z6P1_DESAT|nr:flagellar filament capping protein FliD [Desulfurivibrio alkaliphilus]ADH85000.1 flagellar hook-associated 2 domain protein [Desulfurivibrio alkaliphilus AHT 2]
MSVGSISTLGVGSGLELQSILEDLRGIDEKQRLDPLKKNIDRYEAQLEAFTVVQNKLLDMRSHVRDLGLETTYLTSAASSSNESVATATAAAGVAEQSLSMEVERLASRSTLLSEGVADRGTVISDDASVFSYRVGDGDLVTVEVPEGTTLEGLVQLINNDPANAGVSARIIDNGDMDNPFQLILRANETGSNNFIQIEELPDASPAMDTRLEGEEPAALNASFILDGISYRRQGNTVANVIDGLTFELQQTGLTTLSVSQDTSNVRELVVDLVAAYNEVVQEIAGKSRFDEETGKPGVLARTTVSGLRHELQNLMTATYQGDESGAIRNMFDLGLEFQRDGSIVLNEEMLDEALAANPQAVRDFMLGDFKREAPGFADRLQDRLGSIASYGGQISTERNSAEDRIRDLETRIESERERLDRRYAVLTRQFIELDSYMSRMTQMSDYLTSQFDSLSQLAPGSRKK